MAEFEMNEPMISRTSRLTYLGRPQTKFWIVWEPVDVNLPEEFDAVVVLDDVDGETVAARDARAIERAKAFVRVIAGSALPGGRQRGGVG